MLKNNLINKVRLYVNNSLKGQNALTRRKVSNKILNISAFTSVFYFFSYSYEKDPLSL